MGGCMSLFHAGLTLGGSPDLFCEVPGHGRVSFTNSFGSLYFGNLTGPRHQVYHRQCEEHDLPLVPGLGRRSVAIMIRTGLFPWHKSRDMERLPATHALWAWLKGLLVDSLLDPRIRLPTLEEVKQATRDRARATAAAPVHKPPCVAPIEAAEHDDHPTKRLRVMGKTNVAFTWRG